MTAIINGKVVTVTGETYENGTVLVEDGKIKAVGQNIPAPQNAQVVDASGCWVMPGLIDCHTHTIMLLCPSVRPASPPCIPHLVPAMLLAEPAFPLSSGDTPPRKWPFQAASR